MADFIPLIGLVVFLFLGGLFAFFVFVLRGRWPVFRSLPGFESILTDLGRSVESGTRIHVALGHGEIIGPGAEAELVGLATVGKITQAASISDRPPVVTSGDGATALLSQDVMFAAYRRLRSEERYDPALGRIAGLGPMGYAAGAMVIAKEEKVSATLMLGAMGTETAIIADAASQCGTVVAAVTEPVGQAAAFVTADHPLFGEELFSAGTYLRVNPAHAASLRAQDVIRWVTIAAIVAGALVSTLLGFLQ